MNNIKKVYMFAMLCMLGISTTHGSVRISKAQKIKKLGPKVDRRIRTFSRRKPTKAVHSSVTLSETGGAARQAIDLAARSTSMVRAAPTSRQLVKQIESLTGNTLSRAMQRRLALEARPYLDELDWVKTPRQPASYSDVTSGIYTLGNLTRMSEEQYAEGTQAYEQAVKYMQEFSKSINAEIYYLGTSEVKSLLPDEIRQRLNEISLGQSLVNKARIVWGDNYTLVRISIYWQTMQEVYSMLGMGVYHPIRKGKLEPVKRSDGHVYVAEEFALHSEGVLAKVPRPDWRTPAFWLCLSSRGVLPKHLRVAVLQDDKDVIKSVKKMKKKANLKGWELDFYDDPEAFLREVPYKNYDMILTDVLIKNGGGRYLARQLRDRVYEGTILTLSGFEGSVHGGEEFFNDGIDGMISLGEAPDLSERIWVQLNTYFILKKKYNWQH